MIPYLPVGRPGGPVVLVYHGLGSHKEVQLKELNWLADAGFLAIGVDAVGHGERRWPDFEARMRTGSRAALNEMVQRTVDEIPALVTHLSERFHTDRFGITGISMGGFITFAAVPVESRLRAAVPILGSPELASPNFPHTPLLALNAGQDQHVPPEPARTFVQQLRRENAAYHEYPESDHFMREQDWNDVWAKTINWFQRFL